MTVGADDQQLEGCVWVEVLRLALSAGSGRLQHTGVLAAGCRGALVIDAVERGVITYDGGQLQFDNSIAGPSVLATLLADCDQHPRRTMAELLQRGRPHLSEFIAELVRTEVWQRHGVPLDTDHSKYQDRDAQHYQQIRADLGGHTVRAEATTSPHEAAVAAVARVLNLQAGKHRSLNQPADDAIQACGPLGWIVTDVTTYLIDAQQTDLAAGRTDGLANTSQLATS